jgi:uncharacterized membrane protein YfcA
VSLIDPTVAAWAVAIATLAGLVHGYSGFGGALLMVPLLSLLLRPVDAVVVTTVAAVIGQLPVTRQAIRQASWTDCAPFLIGIVPGMSVGILLLVDSDVGLLRRFVGMSTLAAAITIAVGWAYRGPRGSAISGAFGALCGFLAGATGQGGPVAVTYFMAAPLEPRKQRGSIVAVVTGMVMVTFVAQVLSGAVTTRTLLLGLVMGFPLLAAVYAGSRLFERLPKQNYRRATLLLLFLAGVAALLK